MTTPLPHHYFVSLAQAGDQDALVEAAGRPPLMISAPPEFDGLPGTWSPEHLLLSAVASCYFTTFRVVAHAMHLEWGDLHISVEGALELVERKPRFTAIDLTLNLRTRADEIDRMRRAIQKAKDGCIVAAALRVPVGLAVSIEPFAENVSRP